MSKLYFKYGSMNSGKTMKLIQDSYNYEDKGLKVIILKPLIDNRNGNSEIIKSRIGIEHRCKGISLECDCYELIKALLNTKECGRIDAVMVDEVQFLSKSCIDSLGNIVDLLNIPVLCYGLRTDFKGELFEGSCRLLAIADKLEEIKGICHCGKKATMVLRVDEKGTVIKEGKQIEVGGNDKYIAVCRFHYKMSLLES